MNNNPVKHTIVVAKVKQNTVLVEKSPEQVIQTNNKSYVYFPIATKNDYGMVKPGRGINVKDGVISVTSAVGGGVYSFDSYKDFTDWLDGTFERDDSLKPDDLVIGNTIRFIEDNVSDVWYAIDNNTVTLADFKPVESNQNYVRTDAITDLTEEQKAFVRDSIDVTSEGDISDLKAEVALNSADRHKHDNIVVLDGITASYTTEEKTKLTGISEGANRVGKSTTNGSITIDDVPTEVYKLPEDVVQDNAYVHTDKNYTEADQTKLHNLENGAQVNKIESITVNNTPTTIDTSKNVNISVVTQSDIDTTVSAHNTNTGAHNDIREDVALAKSTADEAKSIAMARPQAKTFDTLQHAVGQIKAYDKADINVGSIVLMLESKVPDLWIYSVEDNYVDYTWVNNKTFVDALEAAPHYVQVGYFKLAHNETNVDLTGYVRTTTKVNNKELKTDITLTAGDVGADVAGSASSAVTTHNTANDAHTTLFDKKLDKVTEQEKVYGTDRNAHQTTIQYNVEPYGDGLVKRTSDGRVKGAAPTENNDLVTKEYTDTKANDKVDVKSQLGASENDNATIINEDGNVSIHSQIAENGITKSADFGVSANLEKVKTVVAKGEVNNVFEVTPDKTLSSKPIYVEGTAETDKVIRKGDLPPLYSTTGQNTDGAMTQKATTDALDGKFDKTGGDVSGAITATGHITGNYIKGSWLQTTGATELGNDNYEVPVLSSGWIYKRTKNNVKTDLGITALETNKQNKLVAGKNITINEETNTISAEGGGTGGTTVTVGGVAQETWDADKKVDTTSNASATVVGGVVEKVGSLKNEAGDLSVKATGKLNDTVATTEVNVNLEGVSLSSTNYSGDVNTLKVSNTSTISKKPMYVGTIADENKVALKKDIPKGGILYDAPGQNTDGAMTQKAISNNTYFGEGSFSDEGGAIGKGAISHTGGFAGGGDSLCDAFGAAVGYKSISQSGFSGGYYAQVGKTSDGLQYIDAIQLGTGRNETPKTLQVYDKTVMNEDGSLMTAGFAVAKELDVTSLQTNSTKIQNANGGFAGGSGAKTNAGGSIGNATNSDTGGAVGFEAYSTYGGAIGSQSRTDSGGAIGNVAVASSGGAVGSNAKAGDGFSGGRLAQVSLDTNSIYIDAIQLGTGTNNKEKTFQVYADNIYDATTHTITSTNATFTGSVIVPDITIS